MKPLTSLKSLAAVALALGALAAASTAQARDDVYFSVGVRTPGVYLQSTPVYVQPAPVYVRPAPVYAQPRVVYVPAPAYYGQPYRRHWEHRGHYRPYGDMDRDGIPNQYDRDRDGDGVRNRYDRRPDNPYRN